MRVVENARFNPMVDENGTIVSYESRLTVEVSEQQFTASRVWSVEEFEDTFPSLREFVHDALRNVVMTEIRKKLFEGVK